MSDELDNPKKYGNRRLILTPEMFEEAGRLALSYRHLAGIFGVNKDTINERMKEPEFREAFQRGRQLSETEVIRCLFQHMRDGDLRAAIFLAQAWCGLSTKAEVKHEGEVTTRYLVEAPVDQTPEQWQKSFGERSQDRPSVN